jgi:hypothetical protein
VVAVLEIVWDSSFCCIFGRLDLIQFVRNLSRVDACKFVVEAQTIGMSLSAKDATERGGKKEAARGGCVRFEKNTKLKRRGSREGMRQRLQVPTAIVEPCARCGFVFSKWVAALW